MMYETLYSEFKNAIPESVPFLEQAEKMYDLDESDGQHVLFGLAIERYVYDRLLEKDIATIQKIASFIEEMETASDERIVDVIEQTVIEHLISSDRILVASFDSIWGTETKKAFKSIATFGSLVSMP